MHGPGGGVNSHMACTLEAVSIESSGTSGQQVGPPARGYNDPLFHDWFYLPGPIIQGGATPPGSGPYPPGVVFLRLGSKGPRMRALQRRLNSDYPLFSNLEVDGEFGPQTEARRQGVPAPRRSGSRWNRRSGNADHARLADLVGSGATATRAPRYPGVCPVTMKRPNRTAKYWRADTE